MTFAVSSWYIASRNIGQGKYMSNRYRYYQLCIWLLINVELRYHSNRVFSTIGLIAYYQLLEISNKVRLLSTVQIIELLNKYGLIHYLKSREWHRCVNASRLLLH